MKQFNQNDVVQIDSQIQNKNLNPYWYVSYDIVKMYNLYCPKTNIDSEYHKYYFTDIKSNIGIILDTNICAVATEFYMHECFKYYMSHLVLVGDHKMIIPNIALHKLS